MINSRLSAPEVHGQERVGVGRREINNIEDTAFFPSFKEFPLFFWKKVGGGGESGKGGRKEAWGKVEKEEERMMGRGEEGRGGCGQHSFPKGSGLVWGQNGPRLLRSLKL